MKRLLTTISMVVIFLIYAFLRRESAAGVGVTSNPTPDNPSATGSDAISAATPTPTSSPNPTTSQYKNGSYTGTVEDAYYGNVQVRAMISGGKITDVRFLQYPNDRETSRLINAQAMPILTQQAIQIQSANVDGVSGATDTSMAFRASLGNALSQAK